MGFVNGESRVGGRVYGPKPTVFGVLTLAAFVMVALGTPRAAEAQVYIWKDVNGFWTDTNNWINASGGPAGFPNAPGDQAIFSADYTAKRTATIPDTATITVGTIFFTGDAAITINAAGSGRLILNNGASKPQITRIGVPPIEGDVISAPIELRNDVEVSVSDPDAHIISNGPIANSQCACGITKKGAGVLYLRGNNSYLGTTSVEGGRLLLDFTDNVIKGNLEIGTGAAANNIVAEVHVRKSHQIADTSRILIKSQGLLTMDVNDNVGETIVTDGFITIRTDNGIFAPTSLNMTGGTVDSRTNGKLLLNGNLTATSSARGPARIFRASGNGVLDLGAAGDTFIINDGPSTAHDITIDLPIVAAGNVGLAKTGTGTLRFRANNTYPGTTQVLDGELWLEPPPGLPSIAGALTIGSGPGPAVVDVRDPNGIPDNASVIVGANGSLWLNTTTPESIGALTLRSGGTILIGNFTDGARLVTPALSMEGGLIQSFFDNNTLQVTTTFKASASQQESARIQGGNLVLGGTRTIEVMNGPSTLVDLQLSANILGGAADGLNIVGPGRAVFSGANPYRGTTAITATTVLINGQQPGSPIVLRNATLGGTGTIGPIGINPAAFGATISPGQSPGRLSTGSIAWTTDTVFDVELNDPSTSESDQLAVTGTVNLADARLRITAPETVPHDARWILIDNDGTDPVVGTFFERSEGETLEIGRHAYVITYRGGDGNDVALEPLAPLTYYLAEGATGDFFDDDVLIANPNNEDAVATLTFLTERSSRAPASELAAPSATARAMPLREGGATVVVQRVVPARARITVHVDEIEGLEDASASVEVKTPAHLPLIVERTMFWDPSYYGGHTANAVAKPERRWIFAEGFQGFFDTYILIANANATKTAVTLTFLRENDTPVVKTVEVEPFARKTIHAGAYDELQGRAFGVVLDSTEPVIAERAMYFANQPNRIWAGGHVNTGIVAPSRSWFHAEGATGTFFNTFILLSNPQTTEANVEVRFLLADGTVITREKKLAPQQRLTINPAGEGDTRLENAAVSTVVQSDVPIVSERSMYWEGDVARGLGEGHNSSGVTETGMRWGLAEGRIGLGRAFDTYILLANPSTEAARVRVTWLRESGAPIVKEYDVPATSRFNIDVKSVVEELRESSFGADIEVLNEVPIAVERSMYWNAIGAFWAGGTNALATPLPPLP